MDESVWFRTFEILERTGLNWSVVAEPLPHLGFAIRRRDTSRLLGVSVVQAAPVQNAELVEKLVVAADHIGITFSRGGVLHGGEVAYLQAEVGRDAVRRNPIKHFATVIWRHIGQPFIVVAITDVIDQCRTFHVYHSTINHFRLDSMVLADHLRRAIHAHQHQVMPTYRRMAATEVDTQMERPILMPLMRDGLGVSNPDAPTDRERARIIRLEQAIRYALHTNGNTLWGVFNGVLQHSLEYPEQDPVLSPPVGIGHHITSIGYWAIAKWLQHEQLMGVFSRS